MSSSSSKKIPFYLLYFPIILCFIVFGIQMFRAQKLGQTPWKGGGFGMFSSIDGRFIRVYMTEKDKDYPVEIPKSLKSMVREFRALPSNKKRDLLAKEFTKLPWANRGDDIFVKVSSNDPDVADVTHVKIQFWTYTMVKGEHGPELKSKMKTESVHPYELPQGKENDPKNI